MSHDPLTCALIIVYIALQPGTLSIDINPNDVPRTTIVSTQILRQHLRTPTVVVVGTAYSITSRQAPIVDSNERVVAVHRTVSAAYTTPQARFLSNPPKSPFKELFIGTELGRTLENMSNAKFAPDGLKQSECERNINYRPPIPYIPEKDAVSEALNEKSSTIKVKLQDGMEQHLSIWTGGTPEEFLNHVGRAKNVMGKKGWSRDQWDEWKESEKQAVVKINNYEKAISGEAPIQGLSVDQATAKLKSEQAALTTLRQQMSKAVRQMFQLYANLLDDEPRSVWDKIVEDRTESEKWMDIYGEEQSGKTGKTYAAYLDCLLFHLQTVFKSDAAETQQKYIRTGLKKPARVPVRQFFARVSRLNEYLATLPCLKESTFSTKETPLVDSYTSNELAKILLEACPATWQDQYKLVYGTGKPVSKENLLGRLETIEDSMKMQSLSNKASDKSNGTEKNGKRKGMNSSADRIPKKKKAEKFCQLCKEHGGAHSTHNTSECRKYEKDGTPKNGGTKKPFLKNAKGKSNYAQIRDEMADMRKDIKKFLKGGRKRRPRRSDDYSDSDSE